MILYELKENQQRLILKACIALGISISLFSLIYNRSLWLDEAMLAKNIVEKSFSELLLPLDLNQVAPIGFLMLEKGFATLFNNTDFSLRIVPFLSSIASIYFLYKITTRLIGSKRYGLIAAAMLALNYSNIYYATEVKQYALDVCIALAIFLVALNYKEKPSKKTALWYIAIGVVSVWFSNIAVILLFTTGLYCAFMDYKRTNLKRISAIIFCWLASFSIYYLNFIHNHPTKDYMLIYWEGAFLPFNPISTEFVEFSTRSIWAIGTNIYTNTYLFVAFLIVLILGIIHLFREKKYAYAYLLLSPVLLHVILSGLKLYPFSGRLVLYITPLLLIGIVYGITVIEKFITKRFANAKHYVSILAVLMCFLPLASRIPIQIQEVKPLLQYAAQEIKTDESLYLFHISFYAYDFYKNDYPELNEINTIKGSFFGDDTEKYVTEILDVKANTIWIMFSHKTFVNDTEQTEEAFIMNRITATHGIEIVETKNYPGATLYKIVKP